MALKLKIPGSMGSGFPNFKEEISIHTTVKLKDFLMAYLFHQTSDAILTSVEVAVDSIKSPGELTPMVDAM